jgi:hypothetical protein
LSSLEQKIKTSPPEFEEFWIREFEWFLEDPKRADTFEYRPIPIAEWLEAPYGANLNHALRPRIKQILCEVFEDPEQYDEVVIDGGIGIGKSFLSGAGAGYLAHRLLCLKSPKQYFNLAGGAPIAIMNMSVNGNQARKVVFSQIMDAVAAPWFEITKHLPDPDVKSELRLPKYVQVMPGNSKDTFFIGFDLYTGILDEGAWHDVTEDKDYAEEGYSAMQRRIKSRFPGIGKLFIVTSPRYVDDFVERKMREAIHNPKIYARRVRSWESMPPTMDVSSFFYFDPDRDVIYSQDEIDDHHSWQQIIEDRTIITPKHAYGN